MTGVKGKAAITAENVDLTNCDREQIHIPGSVQPHGVLLVVKEPELTILQVSNNAPSILGVSPDKLICQPLSAIMQPAEFRYWEQQVLLKRLDANPLYMVPLQLLDSTELFEGTVHRHDGVLLLQLERHKSIIENRSLDVYASARGMLTDLQRTRSSADFFTVAARSVREHTGYDRVVVYKFLENGSGEVLGESKREDLPSWLGLRYPASDIPKQARELYLRSWLRIIADIDATPAAMEPLLNPVTGRPLDMSYCVLRAVSPVHIEYMRNIGAQASMSLSLIKDDKLWGLIACHHHQPKQVSHAARIASEILAHSVSLQIGSKEAAEHAEYLADLRGRISDTLGTIDLPLLHGGRPLYDLLGCFRSTGLAIVADEEITLCGETPSEQQLREMLPWLGEQALDAGVCTFDRLADRHPPAQEFKRKASGLLALRIQHPQLQWLLWFRPEVLQTVIWAGNPNKPVEVDEKSGEMRLSPRRSFAQWREENLGSCEPWWPGEVEIAQELRQAVVEVVLRRAEQLHRLNLDLAQSNTELESFAYVASHDLKEPLRGIHNYSHMLLRTLQPKLDSKEAERFQMILQLSQRMDELIDSLLHYSRVGKTDLVNEKVELQDLVEQLLTMIKPRLESADVTVRIPKPLPSVVGDRVRLHELFENLIINALKYNNKAEKWIEIGYQEKSPTVFFVRDNGIGIEPRYFETIFRIFKRLHTPDQFGGGTGAGLTIAKRIVERHGGRMWVESTPGQGSSFSFTLEAS